MSRLLHTWQSPVARMKLLAGLLLLLAAALYALATAMQARHPAWGYLASFAEAAMVGAIADWFAVTALFRRPLGLPIPHTAIIPRSKARIGRKLSDFITTHFLATPMVLAKLQQLDLGGRLADWLRHPDNAGMVGRQLIGVARFGVTALRDEPVRDFVQRKLSTACAPPTSRRRAAGCSNCSPPRVATRPCSTRAWCACTGCCATTTPVR